MVWDLIFWVLCCFICIILIASSSYQLLCLVDLEADDLNPVEASSRINPFVIPEFLIQGLLAVLFLVTQKWLMFLMVFPLACYHIRVYMKQWHLIHPTEVFRDLEFEKMFRRHKLFYHLSLLIILIARLVWVFLCFDTGNTSVIDFF